MLKLFRIILLGIFCFLIFSCPQKATVKTELPKYAEQLMEIIPKEKASFSLYRKNAIEKYVGDSNLKADTDAILLPKYETFLTLLKDIKVESKELTELHKRKISLSEGYFNALEQLVIAIESGQTHQILAARSGVKKAIEEAESWQDDLFEIAKDNDVELPKF